MVVFIAINDQDGAIAESGARRHPFCNVLVLGRNVAVNSNVTSYVEHRGGVRRTDADVPGIGDRNGDAATSSLEIQTAVCAGDGTVERRTIVLEQHDVRFIDPAIQAPE